jgi:hypothetical protein
LGERTGVLLLDVDGDISLRAALISDLRGLGLGG